MNTSNSPDAAPVSALRAGLSASDIDVRCALMLARVALQVMTESDPKTLDQVRTALDGEIEGARLEQGESADAVIGIVSQFRDSLGGGGDRVWYIE
jgi:hypothetical protein